MKPFFYKQPLLANPISLFGSWLICFFLFSHCLLAQTNQDSLKELDLTATCSIKGQFTFLTTDHLGYIYAISKNGSFIKYTPSGDSVTAYNDIVRFGKPLSADVSNPFKIILSYRRLPGFTVLDRQLNDQGIVSFQKNGLTNIYALAVSYDNRIWIYDQQQFTLKKIDDELVVLFETSDLRQLTGDAVRVNKILDASGLLYLYDPALGFFIFDYYGNYQTQLPFVNWSDVGTFDKYIYGRTNDTLHVYDRSSFRSYQYKLPVTARDCASILIQPGRIIIRTSSGLNVFAIGPDQFH